MLKTNGGVLSRWATFSREGTEVSLAGFSPHRPDEERQGIKGDYDSLMELSGVSSYLPIAFLTNEEEILLDLDKGGGYYGEYERVNEVPVSIAVSYLADSFTEFVSMLEFDETPPCEIRLLAVKGTREQALDHLKNGAGIDDEGEFGTLLIEAVRFNNVPVIDVCLEHGASLAGAMISAVQCNHPHLVNRLLAVGADINELDDCGKRPLWYLWGTQLPGEDGKNARLILETLLKHGAKE